MSTRGLACVMLGTAMSLWVSSCTTSSQATAGVAATVTPETAASGRAVGCSVVSTEPTPSSVAGLPPVTAADFSMGPNDAPVTLLLYCDFQSPQCELFNRVLDRLVKDHPTDLRVVQRPFGVPSSVVASLDKSEESVRAALAAGNQGKFWEMRAHLHSHYTEWATLSPDGFQTWLAAQASDLGLDPSRFASDLDSAATEARVQDIYRTGVSMGISGIPTVFINGRLQERAAMSYDGLESTIGLIALGSRQFKTCPAFDIVPSRQYVATLHTEKGDIKIKLFAARAPLAVNSFVFLAKHGWFNGVTFHRVIPGFVAQAGDPSGTGSGGPGYIFNNEVFTDLLFDKPGVVGMANSGPDTNGSQFFITYAPEPQLDGGYTVFGQVIGGMDVVESLTPRDPSTATGLPPGDRILDVTIGEQ
jgi:cyclophilin family peptidyl-prolyl cis-trans isomerase/protein-disulfide isomerase